MKEENKWISVKIKNREYRCMRISATKTIQAAGKVGKEELDSLELGLEWLSNHGSVLLDSKDETKLTSSAEIDSWFGDYPQDMLMVLESVVDRTLSPFLPANHLAIVEPS